MGKIITYECDQCGCEVVVTETPDTDLGPIYCCGDVVKEVSVQEKIAPRKKAPAKKVVKPAAKKAVKKPARKVAARSKR